MGVYKTIIFLVGLILLAGCGDESLSKEEVIEGFASHYEGDIQSYDSTSDMEILVSSGGATVSSDRLETENSVVVTDPVEIVMNRKEGTVYVPHSFTKDGRVFIHNGMDWDDYSDMYQPEEVSYSVYEAMKNALEQTEEHFELEENDDQYILTYSGTDREIFRVFGSIFQLEFTGVDTTNVQNDLQYIIQKEDLVMTEFNYDSSAENEQTEEKVQVFIEVTYSNMNGLDEIPVPEGLENEF